MTARAQKRLAVAAAIAATAAFIGANAHLLAVAIGSQPACAVVAGAAPAKPAC
ncbi:MAG: hypothetical protein AB7L41_14365 [Flavobacteriaceae bacterium]